MPAKVTKNPDGTYKVATPNRVHAKSTTKEKADAQARLLNAEEHGWKPTGKKMNPKFKKHSRAESIIDSLMFEMEDGVKGSEEHKEKTSDHVEFTYKEKAKPNIKAIGRVVGKADAPKEKSKAESIVDELLR